MITITATTTKILPSLRMKSVGSLLFVMLPALSCAVRNKVEKLKKNNKKKYLNLFIFQMIFFPAAIADTQRCNPSSKQSPANNSRIKNKSHI